MQHVMSAGHMHGTDTARRISAPEMLYLKELNT